MTICCRVLISTMLNYYSRSYPVAWTTVLTHSGKVIPIPTKCGFPGLAALGGCTHGIQYFNSYLFFYLYLFIYQYLFGASFRKVSQRLNRITGSSYALWPCAWLVPQIVPFPVCRKTQNEDDIRNIWSDMLYTFQMYTMWWLQSLTDCQLEQSSWIVN